MTDDILVLTEQFLTHSDEKLQELAEKNQELKLEQAED